MAEHNTTYSHRRHTGEEIDDLLDQSVAATEAANASAKKADDAAENANQEAAKIPGMTADLFDVLAASNCSLEARVTALERTLMAVLSGAAVIPALQVRELGVWGSNRQRRPGESARPCGPALHRHRLGRRLQIHGQRGRVGLEKPLKPRYHVTSK